MEFEAKYEIEKAVSKDQTRSQITNVEFDAEGKRLLATDSYMLAVVPAINVEKEAVAGPIPVEAIKAARKAAGKHGNAFLGCEVGKVTAPVCGATFARPAQPDVQFPPVDQIIPKYKEGDKDTITIGLDANLLATLAKAIGTDGKVTPSLPARHQDTEGLVTASNRLHEERIAIGFRGERRRQTGRVASRLRKAAWSPLPCSVFPGALFY